MPYIGPPAPDRFVAPKAAKQFSGDGSTTAFTLDHAVGSDEDILVSVDGVIQEPSVAYAVSNGTTLTFTAAPSSNSGNNIFVYYLFRTVGTVSHPSNNALQATSGNFTGAFTSLGIDDNASSNVITVSTGGFTLSPATNNLYLADGTLSYYGTTNNVYLNGAGSGGGLLLSGDGTRAENIDIDAADNDIKFTTGSAQAMKIDSAGHVTKPLQPAFSVKPAATQSNLSTSGPTIAFGTEIFDVNADFASNTFTAPVTGKYYLSAQIGLLQVDSASAFIGLDINTSNRHYYSLIDPDFGQDPSYWELQWNGIVDMDANDTVNIVYLQSGGTAQADVEASHTNFTGCLIA